MKRQRIRKTILFISFLLFPVTIYYLSPYLIITAGLEGIISGSFIVFISLFLTSLLFGRAFCGWLCPCGGIGECCDAICDKRVRGRKRFWLKYFIWAPWVIAIVLIFIFHSGPVKPDFFYMTKYGISISEPAAYILYFGILALYVIPALIVGKRTTCHYICWMAPFMIIGTAIKNKLRYPSLHLQPEKEKCNNCKICERNCPMSLPVGEMVQKGSLKNPECILCGECVDNCPKKAIKFRFRHAKSRPDERGDSTLAEK